MKWSSVHLIKYEEDDKGDEDDGDNNEYNNNETKYKISPNWFTISHSFTDLP